ncbi:transglycosylase family protein [Kitasatospora sp. NPDC088160]|uniref:transglycosylase family protein n=1 Tax=Kitasatospora sp. NPDC088160 TaxID=3364072 RepID=UPI00381BA138
MPENKSTARQTGHTRRTRSLAAVALGAAVLSVASQAPAQAASVATWDKVAQCESTGNWSINTNNGNYGGLQITLPTWKAYGGVAYASRPDLASKKQQILVAEKILAGQGPGAWPNCNAGLSTDHAKPYSDRIGAYDPATQTFYESNDNSTVAGSVKFGNAGWIPLVGDWNGDGVASVGAYDPSTATFYLSNDNSTTAVTAKFGNPGWIPLVGDWNKDGKDSIGAYDPATATFYESNDNSTVVGSAKFGNPGWTPLVGDWNGDGVTSIGAYDPNTQTFYLSNDNSTTAVTIKFGNPGWKPLVGDWNGSGKDSVGGYDPATATFYLTNDNSTAAVTTTFGNPGWIPLKGSW